LTSFPPIPLLSLPTSPYPRKQVFGRRERGFPPWKRLIVRVDDGSLHYIKTFRTPKDDLFSFPLYPSSGLIRNIIPYSSSF